MHRITSITRFAGRACHAVTFGACLTFAAACRDGAAPVAPNATAPMFAKGGPSGAASAGHIFYGGVSNAGQDADVFVMNADGSAVTQLTVAPGVDGMPAAPADGRSVVFMSRRDGTYAIYSMKADGSGATRLTTSEFGDTHPAISPDGRRIAFVRADPVTLQIDLYVMRPNGTNVTHVTNDAAIESTLTFSPDGQQIAFERWSNGDREIYRINIDGTGLVNLTNNPTSDDTQPAWAPDGSLIAFGSERDGQDVAGDPDVYTMNPDGSNVIRRTTIGSGGMLYPTWSPDSKRVLYAKPSDDAAAYTVALDGSAPQLFASGVFFGFSWVK